MMPFPLPRRSYYCHPFLVERWSSNPPPSHPPLVALRNPSEWCARHTIHVPVKLFSRDLIGQSCGKCVPFLPYCHDPVSPACDCSIENRNQGKLRNSSSQGRLVSSNVRCRLRTQCSRRKCFCWTTSGKLSPCCTSIAKRCFSGCACRCFNEVLVPTAKFRSSKLVLKFVKSAAGAW
jgi:hypothetical protein